MKFLKLLLLVFFISSFSTEMGSLDPPLFEDVEFTQQQVEPEVEREFNINLLKTDYLVVNNNVVSLPLLEFTRIVDYHNLAYNIKYLRPVIFYNSNDAAMNNRDYIHYYKWPPHKHVAFNMLC